MKNRPGDASKFEIPPLTEPALGAAIVDGAFAYRTRQSAHNQAGRWNEILELDPVNGRITGFVVGVGPIASQVADGPGLN